MGAIDAAAARREAAGRERQSVRGQVARQLQLTSVPFGFGAPHSDDLSRQ